MTSPCAACSTAPDPAFLALAAAWTRDYADVLLGFVWAAYDRMRADMPAIDARDLERTITQRLRTANPRRDDWGRTLLHPAWPIRARDHGPTARATSTIRSCLRLAPRGADNVAT